MRWEDVDDRDGLVGSEPEWGPDELTAYDQPIDDEDFEEVFPPELPDPEDYDHDPF